MRFRQGPTAYCHAYTHARHTRLRISTLKSAQMCVVQYARVYTRGHTRVHTHVYIQLKPSPSKRRDHAVAAFAAELTVTGGLRGTDPITDITERYATDIGQQRLGRRCAMSKHMSVHMFQVSAEQQRLDDSEADANDAMEDGRCSVAGVGACGRRAVRAVSVAEYDEQHTYQCGGGVHRHVYGHVYKHVCTYVYRMCIVYNMCRGTRLACVWTCV